MLEKQGLTISRFLVEEERKMPGATGVFTGLLNDIALAAKIISREVNHAGLAG
ncbi:MAG TPA: class 1 fructose-bisphosphatase, partial [Gemmatimonadetes bacterium]|nr:class 1 fructose-bisphosphatase [Gemmatimonadota bacterium]